MATAPPLSTYAAQSDLRSRLRLALILAMLLAARDRSLFTSKEVGELTAKLKTVNEALWQVEDDLRSCERVQDFGPRFVELARSVYRHNDRRASLKRRLNDLLGTDFAEEKDYTVQADSAKKPKPAKHA